MVKVICTVIGLIALCVTLAAASHFHHPDAYSGSIQLRTFKPPTNGVINVAFIVSDNTALIDLAGPWEVFGDTMLAPQGGPWRGGGDMIMPFNLYAVSDSQKPISAAGLQIVPNYTFENAPKPQVIVVPAQGGRSEAQKKWLLENARTADITMSVCTGASMLAAYGLLDHQRATTHHMFVDDLQKKYAAVQFISGLRYIDNDKVATAGGLSSGIDLALHVVERYYGREIAQASADYMEYKGELWKNPQYGAIKYVSGR
ncbi:MAG: DJ-1/PfpI family protein [Candidatus Acidiferrum sp.]|jgi:transcriptional regulator GlxA family with amidase domain